MKKEVPESIQTWYWGKVKRVTVVCLLVWITIAIILPAISPGLKNVQLGPMPPLHWYMNAFIVIVIGIITIFVYAKVMNGIDQELRKKLEEGGTK